MSAWKAEEEEVPPSKIALKMVNVLVSMICLISPRSMVVVCGILYCMYFILVLFTVK